MFTTNSIYNNSFLHRLNPVVKIIGFILIVAMIFVPLGFFSQIILFIILSSLFIISRISRKTFWNIIKSVLILFVLLLLINWVIYKEPITAYISSGSHPLGNPSMLWGPVFKSDVLPNNVFVSNIWGGKVQQAITGLGDITNIPGNTLNDPIQNLQYIVNQNNISQTTLDNLWNRLNANTQEALLDKVREYYQLTPDSILNTEQINIAKQFHWLLSANSFSIAGVEYKTISFQIGTGITNGIVIYNSYWYTLSPVTIQLAIYVSLKVMLMIMVATLLTSTTNSLELTYGFEKILSPLKIFRLPVNEASMMIAIALRFIPSLLSESKRIMNAQASRGIDFRNGGFATKMKSLVSLVVPLFSIAFKKAEELANAIDARAYNPRYARTKYRKFRITPLEWIGFSFLALLLGVFIGMVVNKIIIYPFGIFEIGLLC